MRIFICDWQFAAPINRLVTAVVACLAIGGLPALASAQAKSQSSNPVEIKLERKKVVVLDGKEVLSSANVAKPGEVIEETATYFNRSKRNFKVEATLPVPQYTELVTGSALPAAAKASVDGKTFAAIPLKRKVKQANGVVVEQLVPLTEYRFLRWSAIDLGPEKSFMASARFKLTDAASGQVAQAAR